jgi:heterogeneous nuclear rnp K-like protein
MADNTTTRKRSRSPTDVEQPKESKRLNLGASPDSNDERHAADKSSSGRSRGENTLNNASGEQTDGAIISAEPETNKSESKDGAPPVPQSHISMRCLIVTQDASIIIGRGGAHVNEIRQKSGAKVMVSESIPGNPERILNVGGPLDAVSKARLFVIIRVSYLKYSI